MHISKEPMILERQLSLFGKILSLIRTFIYGYCEVLNMKLNIWLDIPWKYKDDPFFVVSFAVDIIFRKIN